MRWFPFLRRSEKESVDERAELEQAKQKMHDLDRRTERLKRENHFVQDIKRVLGAQ